MHATIDEHRVDTGRIGLSVRERPGGDPPIVLVHGLGNNARWWDLVGEHLAPEHRLIAVDQRGHGLSEQPDDGYDLAEAVADLEALAACLALPTAIIAGHSWGATVALRYAATHPEGVLGVVCVDGGIWRFRDHFGDSWDLAAVAMAAPEFHGLTAERMTAWVAASPLAEGSDAATAAAIVLGNFDDPSTAGELRPRLTAGHHMELARALYEADVDALLGLQRRPVLLIPAVGGDLADERRAAVVRGLATLGELGTVTWVDGDHDLPVQRPREVALAMAEFARTLAVPPTKSVGSP